MPSSTIARGANAHFPKTNPPQIKEITMDNAKLLLQIDNANLTNNDFKNKYWSKRPSTAEVTRGTAR